MIRRATGENFIKSTCCSDKKSGKGDNFIKSTWKRGNLMIILIAPQEKTLSNLYNTWSYNDKKGAAVEILFNILIGIVACAQPGFLRAGEVVGEVF